MPEPKPMQLRKRIAKTYPLKLELDDDSGDQLIRSFNLSLDFNAACLVQARIGKSLLDGDTWENTEPITISTIFYAAVLAKHPEYRTVDDAGEDTDEGLEVIRSFIDAGNAGKIHDACWMAFVGTLSPERQAFIKARREELARKAAEKAATEDKTPVPNEQAPAAMPLQTQPEAAVSATSPG